MFGTNETSSSEFQTTETSRPRSFFTSGIAILSAIAVTAALMSGYAYLRWRHTERVRSEAAKNQQLLPKPSPPAQVQLFVDDAMIKGSEAVLGGTVLNISSDTLTGVTIELELKRRKDNSPDVRVLSLVPGDLQPQQQGRYSVTVPSHEFRETRVLRIKSARSASDIPFKTLPGAQRPNERLPTKEIIIVKPAPKRGKGEEFINTPENPVRVP